MSDLTTTITPGTLLSVITANRLGFVARAKATIPKITKRDKPALDAYFEGMDRFVMVLRGNGVDTKPLEKNLGTLRYQMDGSPKKVSDAILRVLNSMGEFFKINVSPAEYSHAVSALLEGTKAVIPPPEPEVESPELRFDPLPLFVPERGKWGGLVDPTTLDDNWFFHTKLGLGQKTANGKYQFHDTKPMGLSHNVPLVSVRDPSFLKSWAERAHDFFDAPFILAYLFWSPRLEEVPSLRPDIHRYDIEPVPLLKEGLSSRRSDSPHDYRDRYRLMINDLMIWSEELSITLGIDIVETALNQILLHGFKQLEMKIGGISHLGTPLMPGHITPDLISSLIRFRSWEIATQALEPLPKTISEPASLDRSPFPTHTSMASKYDASLKTKGVVLVVDTRLDPNHWNQFGSFDRKNLEQRLKSQQIEYLPLGRMVGYHPILIDKPDGNPISLSNKQILLPEKTWDAFQDYRTTLLYRSGIQEIARRARSMGDSSKRITLVGDSTELAVRHQETILEDVRQVLAGKDPFSPPPRPKPSKHLHPSSRGKILRSLPSPHHLAADRRTDRKVEAKGTDALIAGVGVAVVDALTEATVLEAM